MKPPGTQKVPAISRSKLSRPIRDGIRDGLVTPGVSILDYGCGRGDDVRILRELGYNARGWDPVFCPTPPPEPASVVNLGYVLNVIPEESERDSTLLKAFELAQEALIVSAYVHNGKATQHQASEPHLDGVLTSRGTFQKLFYHKELGDYLRRVLPIAPQKADFGVYYVRKQPAQQQGSETVDCPFGEGRDGLVVVFAASYWRPIGKLLKRELSARQREVLETEFPSYVSLCDTAESFLNLLRTETEIKKAYRQATFGKKTREALYVHRSSVRHLPEILKLVVATAYEVASTSGPCHWELVKIGPTGEVVSFLDCEPFEQVDYPALRASVVVHRADRSAKRRIESATNPSIYHRKELFLHPSHPWFDGFRELTRFNENNGLLSRSDIGRRAGWVAVQLNQSETKGTTGSSS